MTTAGTHPSGLVGPGSGAGGRSPRPEPSDAARRFERGGLRLADVSAACGFSDQAHLSREFQTLAGVSPQEVMGLRRAEGAVQL